MSELLQSLNPSVQVLLTWLLEPLTNFSFGLLAAGFLILLMAGSLIVMWRKLHRTNKDLKAATKRLQQCDNEEDFRRQFEDVSATLKALPKLEHAWSEYEETLIRPLHDDSVDDPSFKVYRNTQRPQAFFSESAIIGDIKPWIKSGTFIGFGLLLTFAGLVAALNESGQAFSGNADEVKAALASLLAVAGAKFLASVGGLGCAVVQDMIAGRMYRTSAKRSLNAFNKALEKRLQFVSVASIATEQYGHAQRQTKRLEELSDQLATRLGEQFEQAINQLPQKFGQEMKGVMAPMSEQLISFTGNMASSSSDALENMVDQFVQRLENNHDQAKEATEQQLQQIAASLESSVSALNLSNDHMNEAALTFQQSLSSGASHMSAGIESTLVHITGVLNQLASDTDNRQQQHLDTLTSTQEGMVGQFQVALERFEHSATAVADKLSDAMTQQAEQTTSRLTSGATQAASILSDSSQQLSEQLSHIANAMSEQQTTLNQTMSKQTEQMSQSLAKLRAVMNESAQQAGGQMAHSLESNTTQAAERISQLNIEMAKSMSESMENVLSRVESRLDESSTQTQQELQQLATALASSVSALGDNQSSMRDAAAMLQTSLSGGAASMSQEMQTASDSLTAQSKQMIELLATLRSSMNDSADQASQAMAKSLEQNALQSAKQVAEASTQMSSSIASSMNTVLSSLEKKLTLSSDKMSESLNDWQSVTQRTCTALSTLNQQFQTQSQTLTDSHTNIKAFNSTLKQSSDAIVQVLKPLSEGTQQLAQASDSLQHSAEQLAQATEQGTRAVITAVESASQKMADNTEASSARMADTLSESQDLLQALHTAWERQSQQLAGADQALEDAFVRITEGLERAMQEIDQYTGTLGSNLIDALENLSALGSELSENIETLVDSHARSIRR